MVDDVDKEFNELFGRSKGKGKGKGKRKGKGKEQEPSSKPKREICIKKYSGNGIGSLHESGVVGGVSKFVTLDKDHKPQLIDKIERANDILLPGDTIDTQNPLPFIFESKEELENCLDEASKWTLDSFFLKVELINRKYVDVEDHYHVLLTADIIWSWLQDRFGYTHYNIFTGDNGSGKNSQLLVFKYLGYRVFYVVSASAPNYYTKMGNVEEGQITIAEDEAGDIAEDREKRNVFKTGYASGASVPKVELEGGRRSEDWLTYCQKWVAMEELSTHKEMKGILDRSFVFRFVAGDPQYNIKDVIKSAGDPKYKPLHAELLQTRKLLFCWRLIHYDDIILDVKLNVKNRSAELTKPLVRLFQNSPIALERILDTLTKFMTERNEIKKGSFESKLFDVISKLKEERNQRIKDGTETDNDKTLSEKKEGHDHDLAFSNPELMKKTIEVMDCVETDTAGLYYSSDVGCSVSQSKITSIAKSKFKAKAFQQRLENPNRNPDKPEEKKNFRCLGFKEKYLERIKSSYQIPDKIEIIQIEPKTENVTLVTPVTAPGGIHANDNTQSSMNEGQNHDQNTAENTLTRPQDDADTIPASVTTVTTATNNSGSDFPPKCYHCSFKPNNKQQYDDHCSIQHRGFSGYPNKASIEAFGLKAQGKGWEA